MNVELPRGNYDAPAPCWIPAYHSDFESQKTIPLRPLIKCQCGKVCGISLHHVHADGTVTASFFHDSNPHPEIGYAGGGCGWHVFLKLLAYHQGEFPPRP